MKTDEKAAAIVRRLGADLREQILLAVRGRLGIPDEEMAAKTEEQLTALAARFHLVGTEDGALELRDGPFMVRRWEIARG